MTMKRMSIVLVMGLAIMMAPISVSATLFNEQNGGRAAWEAAVASYVNVTLPSTNLTQYGTYGLPSGGAANLGDVISFNVPLSYSSGFYYTDTITTQAGTGRTYYYANGVFYDMPNSYTFPLLNVSAFGFDMVPAALDGAAPTIMADPTVNITLYTIYGEVTNTFNMPGGTPAFFGWVGNDVTGFSTYSFDGSYGLGNFVEGAPSVPEPGTLLFLGMGLLGLVGLRRKFKK